MNEHVVVMGFYKVLSPLLFIMYISDLLDLRTLVTVWSTVVFTNTLIMEASFLFILTQKFVTCSPKSKDFCTHLSGAPVGNW